MNREEPLAMVFPAHRAGRLRVLEGITHEEAIDVPAGRAGSV